MGKPTGNMKSFTLVELARVLTRGNERGRHDAMYLFTNKLRDPWGSGETEREEAAKVLAEFMEDGDVVGEALLQLLAKGTTVPAGVEEHSFDGLIAEKDNTLYRATSYLKTRRELLGKDATPNPAQFIIQTNPLRSLLMLNDLLTYRDNEQWKQFTQSTWAQWIDEPNRQDGLTPAGALIDWMGQTPYDDDTWPRIISLSVLINQCLNQYDPWKDLGRFALYPKLLNRVLSVERMPEKNTDVIKACAAKFDLEHDTQPISVRSPRARL